VYNSLFATITSLCVKNNDPNTIWYSGGGYNTNSVYKSTDGGAKWTNISAGLPSLPFYSIVFNKLGNDYEQLYAGSEVGVYFKDGENEWVAFNNGLPNVKIGELEIYYDTLNPENCRLRAATYGRGLWESPVFNPTIPVAGTVSGANILCEKEVAQLYLTGCAGVIQWQESVDVENWNDIVGANTAYYQSEPLIENRYYRAKVTIGYSVYSNPFFVEIKPLPETPFITKIENSLFSSSDEGNQWYNQDGLIPGANEKVFTPTENGTYFVIVTLNDCSSELSNEILIEGLSIGGNAIRDGRFLLFPNPANDQLRVTNYELLINRVVIIDMLGKEVVNIYQNDVNEITIDMSKVPPGLFQVRIETDKGTFTSKVVKR